MGPFPIATRQLKFLIIDIDYFTKLVEAEALATIMEKNVRSFIWRNIVCRYGILEFWYRITGNNSTTTHSGIFAHSWESRIITPPPPTLKPMGRLRSRTNPCSKSSRLGSRGQRAYGRMNYQVFYRHTGQQQGHPQGRCHFD